jgi:PEP-CTERM motif
VSDWGLFQAVESPHADGFVSFLRLTCAGLPVNDPVPAIPGFSSSANGGWKMKSLLQSLILSAVSFLIAVPAAYAGIFRPLPEPETLSLLAVGVVGLLVTRFRKRK